MRLEGHSETKSAGLRGNDERKPVDRFPGVKSELKITPRGLSRNEAAGYIGISASLFDGMVKDGRMPKPVHINSRVLWDIKDLDFAFDDLKGEPQANPWDNLG